MFPIFANAGGGGLAPLGQITEEHFVRTPNEDIRRCLFDAKALPLMPPGSSIILNASTAASKGTPAFSVYSATKAAVRSFARNWTLDLKERNIRVNAVSPGVVPTPGYDLMGLTEEQIQGFVASMAATIPLGRVGTPDEIAKVVVFLASDDSSFVNGIELFVDGGMARKSDGPTGSRVFATAVGSVSMRWIRALRIAEVLGGLDEANTRCRG